MYYSFNARKHTIFYHRLVQFCGYLLILSGPFLAFGLYQQTQDFIFALMLLSGVVFFGLHSTIPYLLLHRLKPEGINLGAETLSWNAITSIEKIENSLVFHTKDSVCATLKMPFSFLDISESLRVITDIYPPLEDKIIKSS